MDIRVIIPTYNERENIEDLVNQILALDLDIQLIIVDDNSPDGTGQVAEALAEMSAPVPRCPPAAVLISSSVMWIGKPRVSSSVNV